MTTTDAVFSTVHKNEEYPNPPSFRKREKKREKKEREKKEERERKNTANSQLCIYIFGHLGWYHISCILGVCDFKVRVRTRCKASSSGVSSKWRGIVCQLRKSLGMFGVSCPADLFHTKEEERERKKRERRRPF